MNAIVLVKSNGFDETYINAIKAHAFDRNERLKIDKASEDMRAVFNCPILPKPSQRPKSVHSLTPSDIEVVGAIGDSITVGITFSSITIPKFEK